MGDFCITQNKKGLKGTSYLQILHGGGFLAERKIF